MSDVVRSLKKAGGFLPRITPRAVYMQGPNSSGNGRCTCTAVPQCATDLYRSPAPPLVLLEPVSVVAFLFHKGTTVGLPSLHTGG
ncbi:hypothetical protein Q9233_009888 [Columba guinea]|nr:hypothetical protein Q9233_009888 [Columba guinea]